MQAAPSPLLVPEKAACDLGRRKYLRSITGFFGALLLIPARASRGGSRTPLESWLQTHTLGDNSVLKRLGAAYLAAHPEERDRVHLSDLLAGDGTTSPRLRLVQAIARDWADHCVCLVDGWVLSRSESRLCAALHLMDGPRI
jgi:hypothetical protein